VPHSLASLISIRLSLNVFNLAGLAVAVRASAVYQTSQPA
jgi:hypothetical protein